MITSMIRRYVRGYYSHPNVLQRIKYVISSLSILRVRAQITTVTSIRIEHAWNDLPSFSQCQSGSMAARASCHEVDIPSQIRLFYLHTTFLIRMGGLTPWLVRQESFFPKRELLVWVNEVWYGVNSCATGFTLLLAWRVCILTYPLSECFDERETGGLVCSSRCRALAWYLLQAFPQRI